MCASGGMNLAMTHGSLGQRSARAPRKIGLPDWHLKSGHS